MVGEPHQRLRELRELQLGDKNSEKYKTKLFLRASLLTLRSGKHNHLGLNRPVCIFIHYLF